MSPVLSFPFLATTASLAVLVAGCGAETDPWLGDGGANGSVKEGGALPTDSSRSDGGACPIIQASDYDQSCSTASDCVYDVQGGSVCNPCNEPEIFTCADAILSATASEAYDKALAAALGRSAGIQFAMAECGRGVSCPAHGAGHLGCVSGTCTFVKD